MTLLDRALTKAYSRRSIAARAESEPRAAAPAPVTRGWVARLRPPAQTDKAVRESPAVAPAPPIVTLDRLIQSIDDRTRTRHKTSDARDHAPAEIAPTDKPAYSTPIVPPALPAVWAWPAISNSLLGSEAGPGIRGLASLLCEMLAERRQRSLAFTGPGRGAGRSALLLTMARVLSEERALRVLVIDLDFGNPQLAQLLGVVPQHDLWQAACRNTAAASPLVTLIPDRLSFVPLSDRVSMTEVTAERAATLRCLMQKWRNEFDLVLVDGGPWELFGSLVVRETSTVEACVCVAHADKSAADAADGERYRRAGMDFLGFIETFAPADTTHETPQTR